MRNNEVEILLNLLLSVTFDNYHYHDSDHAPPFQIHYLQRSEMK